MCDWQRAPELPLLILANDLVPYIPERYLLNISQSRLRFVRIIVPALAYFDQVFY